MVVNLIKSKQIFNLVLPSKVKGCYWLNDVDESGKYRELISIEAVNGEWVIKSNRKVTVLDANDNPINVIILKPQVFYKLKINSTNELINLFAESIDPSRCTFRKLVVSSNSVFTIGRGESNNICYPNMYVSTAHARLTFDGNVWSITDLSSRNGTYVNGNRVFNSTLKAGDCIYIMGLKIVIGRGFFVLNNPDNVVKIKSNTVALYQPQLPDLNKEKTNQLPTPQYFYRSPSFHKEIRTAEIKIDPPPQPEKADTIPTALMLGPSLTMGITSLGTGMLAVSNVITNGGDITQALPSLLMAVSMLLGTVLWPVLTKKHEKKLRIKNETKRQNRYLAYLEEVRDSIKRLCKEQSEILNANLVSNDDCVRRIAQRSPNLWERVIGQNDFLTLRLGTGNIPLDANVSYSEKHFSMEEDNLQDAMLSLATEPKELYSVPISFSLANDEVAGILGEKSAAVNMLKQLILQMIALHSYDELKLIFITDETDAELWNFVKFIPHFWDDNKKNRLFASNDDEIKGISAFVEKEILSRADERMPKPEDRIPYYVIISTSKKLSDKCEALEQLLASKCECGAGVLYLAEEMKDLPKETKTVIRVNGKDSELMDKNDSKGEVIKFAAEQFNEQFLEGVSEDIANIELDLGGQGYSLPNMLTFLEMFNVGKIEHLNSLTRWKDNNPTISLQTPIGIDSSGSRFNLDLHEKYHGPHGLVAGMTGSGKSEFIITYILSLAVNYHPDEVAFILIDYKGGGLAGAFENSESGIKLPHLAGTITNLDGAAVNRSLISIQSELRRRQMIFNEAKKVSNEGTMDIYKYQQLYRDKIVSEPVPHLFIISDEFAELKTQQPEFMQQLISAARIGRSLGVHLILATQKPSGVVDDQIWSNSKFRVCLKVQEKADSQEMIKRSDAAEISQTGRFYLQVGFNELFELGQSAWCGADYIPSENFEKTLDSSIQVIDNLGRVLMNVNPDIKKRINEKYSKQIVSVVKYLSDLAKEEKVSVKPLWMPPIPARIFVDKLEEKYSVCKRDFLLNPVVGEYDDPFNQKQAVLTVPFAESGNCLVYGSTGSGKTTFLTTLCYSLIKNHTPEEVSIYVMDFGSETLKNFENAPHVGGVVLAADEEKAVNLFKLLKAELERRRNLFSEFGGDYAGYIRNSGKSLPNIVVIVNNYSGFTETFEDLTDDFSVLSRDGVKYGIYFAVTAGTTNAVSYRIIQNFGIVMSMRLNDATDYSMVIGRTDGILPSNFKGRGLIPLDNVYEFQTAFCTDADDITDFVRTFSEKSAQAYTVRAKQIPVLPQTVDAKLLSESYTGLKNIPVGIDKKQLKVAALNLENKVIYPVLAQDTYQCVPFAEEFARLLSDKVSTTLIDAGKLIETEIPGAEIVSSSFDDAIVTVFNEMVERNNTYKDAALDLASLNRFEEKVIIVLGFEKLNGVLSDDSQDKLRVLLSKAEAIYKIHFVFVDSVSNIQSFIYTDWYKRHLNGSFGIWIGDGVAEQNTLRINKITSSLYDEIGDEYAYIFNRNKPAVIKIISSEAEEEE